MHVMKPVSAHMVIRGQSWGQNGFTCTDDRLDAFCPLGVLCSFPTGVAWSYGSFPCGHGHSVTCECTHPGDVYQSNFQCSDPKYDDRYTLHDL